MSFPKISILFKSTAATAIERGSRGTVALLLRDASVTGDPSIVTLTSVTDIPSGLSDYNKKQIISAFKGGINPPKKVIIYVDKTTATDYAAGLKYLETIKFNYMAVPGIASADVPAVATAIKSMYDSKDRKVKAVLPKSAGDHESILNLTTDDIKTAEGTFTAADYCARLAGIAAGCPLTSSITFQVLSEVLDVPHLTEDEAGAKVDAGEIVLFHDGEKVKIARGVNSLVTTTADKGQEFKKVKIVDILDLVHDDIKKTSEDNYIGKVSNSYDNQCLLVNAINGYLKDLEGQGLLEKGKSKCEIDMDAKRAYLKGIGVDVDNLKDQQIKEYNSRDKVFLKITLVPLDCMEEITVSCYIG